MLLGPSQTILDRFWTKTEKSTKMSKCRIQNIHIHASACAACSVLQPAGPRLRSHAAAWTLGPVPDPAAAWLQAAAWLRRRGPAGCKALPAAGMQACVCRCMYRAHRRRQPSFRALRAHMHIHPCIHSRINTHGAHVPQNPEHVFKIENMLLSYIPQNPLNPMFCCVKHMKTPFLKDKKLREENWRTWLPELD